MHQMRPVLFLLLSLACNPGQGLRQPIAQAGSRIQVSSGQFSRAEAVLGTMGGLAILGGSPWPAVAESPRITAKVELDLSVVKDFQALEKEPLRLVLGLYGDDAPEATARTLAFSTASSYGSQDDERIRPSFKSTIFPRSINGVIEMGKVKGVSEDVDDKGNAVLLYRATEVYSVPSDPERNDIKHDRPGLLTRSRYSSDPSFGIATQATPSRDQDGLVFGEVIESESTPGWLEKLKSIQVYSDSSMEPDGSVFGEWFKAQRKFFRGVAIAAKDQRAEDRRGMLLKRITVTDCKVLNGRAPKLDRVKT